MFNQKKPNSNFTNSSTHLLMQKSDSLKTNNGETLTKEVLPEELPGLEHQDTIVR